MLFAPPTDGDVIKKTNVQNSCGFVDLASQPEIGITGILDPRLAVSRFAARHKNPFSPQSALRKLSNWSSGRYLPGLPSTGCVIARISKAIHDLLDDLEASKQSRLRAWSVLQRLRMLLSEVRSVAIPPPAQKTFDAEGEALEYALRKSSVCGTMQSKVCVPRCAAFEMLPPRRNAKEIIRTLFRRCGKLWIGLRI
jgi:hypothetical protein